MDREEALRLAGEVGKIAELGPEGEVHTDYLLWLKRNGVALATAIHEMVGENQKLEEKLKDCQSGAAMLEEVLLARLERAEGVRKAATKLLRYNDSILYSTDEDELLEAEENIGATWEELRAALPDTGKEKG